MHVAPKLEWPGQAAAKLQASAYDESSGSGDLRYIQLTVADQSSLSSPKAQSDPYAAVQVSPEDSAIIRGQSRRG